MIVSCSAKTFRVQFCRLPQALREWNERLKQFDFRHEAVRRLDFLLIRKIPEIDRTGLRCGYEGKYLEITVDTVDMTQDREDELVSIFENVVETFCKDAKNKKLAARRRRSEE